MYYLSMEIGLWWKDQTSNGNAIRANYYESGMGEEEKDEDLLGIKWSEWLLCESVTDEKRTICLNKM